MHHYTSVLDSVLTGILAGMLAGAGVWAGEGMMQGANGEGGGAAHVGNVDAGSFDVGEGGGVEGGVLGEEALAFEDDWRAG